ncbi:MAG: tRNA epoxyqueuosine(34) reductase QueG [Paludibacteraceae bacterium]|nr:tRNA epoxyqueuosine(34) reductase QueG [Paludibacteraceae bacterium]
MYKQIISNEIKAKALHLAFDACGIAKADFLEADAHYLQTWLEGENQAGMSYMTNHFEKRTDPRLLVLNARSVIVVLMNYYPLQQQAPHLPQIAKYAYGKDYHEVIKDKLRSLLEQIQDLIPGKKISGRVFTDSAPVLERRWAVNAGLGWIGKNTNLIHPKLGSFCFIGELIVDMELAYDEPLPNRCGTCTRCMDTCPTQALEAPGKLNANRCISYLTIESKEAIPAELRPLIGNRLYGCDTCQDACPWNRFAKGTNDPDLAPLNGILDMNKQQWIMLQEETFKETFKFSPIKRVGLEKIQQTLTDCF